MKTNAKQEVIDIAKASKQSDDVVQIDAEKTKTDKRLLKKAAKLVRKLDVVVSNLCDLEMEVGELRDWDANEYDDVEDKDNARFNEMYEILHSSTIILYHMTARMARKYVGKEVAPLENKRKALKAS